MEPLRRYNTARFDLLAARVAEQGTTCSNLYVGITRPV
jgi:hypothetical protein